MINVSHAVKPRTAAELLLLSLDKSMLQEVIAKSSAHPPESVSKSRQKYIRWGKQLLASYAGSVLISIGLVTLRRPALSSKPGERGIIRSGHIALQEAGYLWNSRGDGKLERRPEEPLNSP
jgi:hypothetical protein